MAKKTKKGDGGSVGITAIQFVLDRSGSMQSVKDDTIGAYNAYVEQVAKETPTARLSLSIFDSQSIDTVYADRIVTDVPKLDGDTYVPRASTPLYDAIGKGANELAEVKADRKVLVILTDGYENASREWTRETVKKLLDERQEKDNWLVVYLGANQDALKEGAAFGTQTNNSMTFSTANMAQTMSAVSRATSAYASASSASKGRGAATFTSDERKKALADDAKA